MDVDSRGADGLGVRGCAALDARAGDTGSRSQRLDRIARQARSLEHRLA